MFSFQDKAYANFSSHLLTLDFSNPNDAGSRMEFLTYLNQYGGTYFKFILTGNSRRYC